MKTYLLLLALYSISLIMRMMNLLDYLSEIMSGNIEGGSSHELNQLSEFLVPAIGMEFQIVDEAY
jgi:Na+/H+ antiporter NhaC